MNSSLSGISGDPSHRVAKASLPAAQFLRSFSDFHTSVIDAPISPWSYSPPLVKYYSLPRTRSSSPRLGVPFLSLILAWCADSQRKKLLAPFPSYYTFAMAFVIFR